MWLNVPLGRHGFPLGTDEGKEGITDPRSRWESERGGHKQSPEVRGTPQQEPASHRALVNLPYLGALPENRAGGGGGEGKKEGREIKRSDTHTCWQLAVLTGVLNTSWHTGQ